MGICHGDFNQHNIVFRSEYAAVISFDNICYDVQIGDLARFMRKILEKNNWNMGLGMEMIRAYSDKKQCLHMRQNSFICGLPIRKSSGRSRIITIMQIKRGDLGVI